MCILHQTRNPLICPREIAGTSLLANRCTSSAEPHMLRTGLCRADLLATLRSPCASMQLGSALGFHQLSRMLILSRSPAPTPPGIQFTLQQGNTFSDDLNIKTYPNTSYQVPTTNRAICVLLPHSSALFILPQHMQHLLETIVLISNSFTKQSGNIQLQHL